ncbi:TolA-binding protein [Peptoclostridium litorale DSM 5388]|uniref:Tetratricopeptide repeat protein n=1 Tax=Peptoclostridium litorale DSM 5388 TaxID=1121324 RepID=A0A069RBM5_PEPLI|nr:tetratricopeptide repeat protein [Peptoclostridium litorale]KDR94484.1 hypothetical protein CLIT_17c00110 [Peptoclostridium litorale DSM 5388]SIO35900.1 TolA-binding protein [Peptoclostridium litorale DSM 5388]
MDKNCNFAKLCYAKALNGVKNGDITNAIPELNRSLEMDRANTDALNLLGFCHYMLCEFGKAVGIWKASLSIKPNDNKATMYMDIVESSEFKIIRGQYESGMAYFEQKDYKNAAFKMINVISKKKELVKPYIIAGISVASMGDFEEGISYIEKGLQKDRGNIEAKKYINLFREKDFSPKQYNEKSDVASKKQNTRAEKLGKWPKISIAALMTAVLFVAAFTFRSASLKDAKDAGQNNSAEVKIEKLKSDHFEAKDTGELPKEEAKNSDELPERSDGNLQYKSNASDLKGNGTDEFIENEKEYYQSALKLYRESNYRESAPMFARIAEMGKEKKLVIESMYLAGLAFEKTQDFKNAIEYYKRYIDSDRNGHYYDDSLYNMGLIYYKIDDIENAIQTMKRLKKENPNSVYVNSKTMQIISLQEASQ